MSDLTDLGIYISWVITALTGAFGIGVGYAVLKTDLLSFKHEFKVYKDSAAAAVNAAIVVANEQTFNIRDRLRKLEDKQDDQVGWVRCKDMRIECSDRISADLIEITRQITSNRDTVINHMKETDKLMGRVEQFMQTFKNS